MVDNWKIYNELIDGIPSNIEIDECIIGLHWTYVRANDCVGIAMTYQGSSSSGLKNGSVIGKSLKEIANGAKSWDMLQASVGMAACNAYYNTPAKMIELGVGQEKEQAGTGESIFDDPMDSIIGKKVAVVGHFPYVEKQLSDKCSLYVLERNPKVESDYLDSACEYILPEQDYVYITGMTFTNKTLPRLLTLTKDAKTIMVGPSSPITPKLFSYGIDAVAGFYVTDNEMARQLVSHAAHFEIFKCGRRITYSKK